MIYFSSGRNQFLKPLKRELYIFILPGFRLITRVVINRSWRGKKKEIFGNLRIIYRNIIGIRFLGFIVRAHLPR